jgi:hypothetical protein
MTNILVQETVSKFGYDPTGFTHGSRKHAVFKCSFCYNPFEASIKSVNRVSNAACSRCRSISASYTMSGASMDRHEYYLSKKPGCRSKRSITSTCDFCLSSFTTTFNVLNNKPGMACKKCDAIAAAYSRFKSCEDKHKFYLSRRPSLPLECLDINETVSKFGYSPLNLSSYSVKKIVVMCKYCNIKLNIPMSKFTQRKGKISCWSCMRKKTVETLKEKYGVECTLDIPSVQSKLTDPSTEQMIESVLRERYKIDFSRNYSIGPYSFDFFIPSINLLIECQGDYFHDFKKNGYSGTPQDRSKSTYIEKYTNKKLVWIWEHELHLGRLRKILDYHIYNVLEPEMVVDLKSLIFKQILNHDAHVFLSQYHYLGNLGTVATSFGAFSGDVLIAVCVFGGVTRNQSVKKINDFYEKKKQYCSYGPGDTRELRRFCIKPNVKSKNLASFCLKKFTNILVSNNSKIKIILSFSDPNVGDIGTIYKASNWAQMSNTSKSYHYVDAKTSKIIHKKTVWDSAKGAHMTESDFAVKIGLSKVEELSKYVWVKKL